MEKENNEKHFEQVTWKALRPLGLWSKTFIGFHAFQSSLESVFRVFFPRSLELAFLALQCRNSFSYQGW